MNIRKIIFKDYDEYIKLINSSISKEYFNYFISNILNDNHSIFVCELNNKIIGTGSVFIEQKLTNNGCKLAHIENIYIHPNYQRKGYGKQIINYILNHSDKKKCYRADLVCYDDLIDFYFKNNFTKKQNSLQFLFKSNFK